MPKPATGPARVEVVLADGTVRRATVRPGELLLVGAGGPLPGRLPVASILALEVEAPRRKGGTDGP